MITNKQRELLSDLQSIASQDDMCLALCLADNRDKSMKNGGESETATAIVGDVPEILALVTHIILTVAANKDISPVKLAKGILHILRAQGRNGLNEVSDSIKQAIKEQS